MRVGIIGCGAIGTELAKFLDKDKYFKLIALNDLDQNKILELIKLLKNNKPKKLELDQLIKNSDLIIECASKTAVQAILQNKDLDTKDKTLIVMSTGGLIENLKLIDKIKSCEIILPSGAIAGIDAIKSVSAKIKSLTLTTTKPIKSLKSAPFVKKNNLKLKNKKIIFQGNLEQAVLGFPQNINVAATLYLASKFKGLKIKIISSKTKFNTHEIKATGDFGEITAKTQNLPSKNPKTSYLAVLSAISIIRNLKNNIKVGN